MYPRIIENDSSEPKTHPPGKIVTLFIFMKNFYTVKDKKIITLLCQDLLCHNQHIFLVKDMVLILTIHSPLYFSKNNSHLFF